MNFMKQLQGMLEQGLSGLQGQQTGHGLGDILGGGGQSGQRNQTGLGGLLGPAVLGGLAGALFGGKGAARPALGGALLTGGGAALWNMFTQRMRQSQGGTGPGLSFAAPEQPAPVQDRAERLVRAMVFAARCDGHIDAEEQSNIAARIGELGLGPEAQELVDKALSEPLDPNRIAEGVAGEEEALQLFTISRAVIDQDSFMERNYLDALANALGIPEDVKGELEKHIKSPNI